MPFPKKAQQKGGLVPASELQRRIAKEWALAHQPSLKSTGPKTWEGKRTASVNALKATYSREIKSWESEDFEADCREANEAIAKIQTILSECHSPGTMTVERKFRQKDGKRWAMFSIKFKRKIHQLQPSLDVLAAQQKWLLMNPET